MRYKFLVIEEAPSEGFIQAFGEPIYMGTTLMGKYSIFIGDGFWVMIQGRRPDDVVYVTVCYEKKYDEANLMSKLKEQCNILRRDSFSIKHPPSGA